MQREYSVEDVWQETLAMAWRDRASHEWRGMKAFRAWLLGIARNRVHDLAEYVNAQKRGGGHGPTSFSALVSDDGSVSEMLPPGTTTPSRIASGRESAQVMVEALAALPAELEVVVRLRLFEELPMREVASRVGIGLTTATERFFRGASLYQAELERRLGSSPGGVR